MFGSAASVAADILITALLLVVMVWVLLFGTAAALLAQRADVSRAAAFSTGAIAGPVALGWLAWRIGRRGPQDHADEDDDTWGPGRNESERL